jgi:hypothetical protein
MTERERQPKVAGHGVEVEEVRLPGIGTRYDFATGEGRRVGVVSHRTGRLEFVVYDRQDPDSREALKLASERRKRSPSCSVLPASSRSWRPQGSRCGDWSSSS